MVGVIGLEWDGQCKEYQRVSIQLDRVTAPLPLELGRRPIQPRVANGFDKCQRRLAAAMEDNPKWCFVPPFAHYSHFVGLHISIRSLSFGIDRSPAPGEMSSRLSDDAPSNATYISLHQHLRGSVPTSPRFIATHFLRLFNHYERPLSERSGKIHRQCSHARHPHFSPRLSQ